MRDKSYLVMQNELDGCMVIKYGYTHTQTHTVACAFFISAHIWRLVNIETNGSATKQPKAIDITTAESRKIATFQVAHIMFTRDKVNIK